MLLWHRPWHQPSKVQPMRAKDLEDLDQWEWFLSVEAWERLEKPGGSFPAPSALSCGLKCSMMEAWCGMFHYDKNNKICTPAKVKLPVWSTTMSRLDPRNCPALVLYGIRARIIGSFRSWKPPIPYAIKNQRGASKDQLGFWIPTPLVGGFGCPSWFFMA